MDRKIEKKKWNTKRISIIAGVTLFAALLIWLVYSTVGGKSKYNAPIDRMTISEVTKGPFQVTIPVNGNVLPITTIYLDAVEGGRVEKVFVEDGTDMKAGQPIMKLSDLDLELSLAQQQADVFNVLTQMQIQKNQAQQNSIGYLQNMTDANNAFRDADRIYNLDKKLYAQKAIGSQEYQQAVNAYDYTLTKKKLMAQILSKDSVSAKLQQTQAQNSYTNLNNTLELMKQKVGDLVVKAPVDGQLTAMDAEIGQSINKGERLGEIDVLSGFKVRVNVDEHYLSQVYTGLIGKFNFAEKDYTLKIKKVFSQVSPTGTFQVDMEFVGAVPDGIRRGQTLQILLALSDEKQAILVPKGGFFQATGGNWIFKLSADGKTAYKVDIQLGQQNPDYYEVLSGIKPGDKVVTSSYDNYGDIQELVLTK